MHFPSETQASGSQGWTGRWALSGHSASTVQRGQMFSTLGLCVFWLCGHWDGKSLLLGVTLTSNSCLFQLDKTLSGFLNWGPDSFEGCEPSEGIIPLSDALILVFLPLFNFNNKLGWFQGTGNASKLTYNKYITGKPTQQFFENFLLSNLWTNHLNSRSDSLQFPPWPWMKMELANLALSDSSFQAPRRLCWSLPCALRHLQSFAFPAGNISRRKHWN